MWSKTTDAQKQTLAIDYPPIEVPGQVGDLLHQQYVADNINKWYRNLVFAGGGMKGLAYAGVFRYLEEVGFNPRRLIGVSVGSIYALCLCLGYTSEEIHGAGLKGDWSILGDMSIGALRNYGICNGENLATLIINIIKKKGYADTLTFSELFTICGIDLFIGVYRLEDGKPIDYWHKTAPNMSVAEAVRMSCTVPMIFTPIFKNGSTYIDGGLFNKYPICKFDGKTKNAYTFGICLGDDRTRTRKWNTKSVSSYIHAILSSMRREYNRMQFKEEDFERTVLVDTGDVDTLDYDINERTRVMLARNGYSATRDFFCSRFPIVTVVQ